MKAVSLTLIGALLILFRSVDSSAIGIYQSDYRYSFDGIARDGARRQTFVIREDECTTAPYLTPVPRFPALSVRVSRDVATGKESTHKGPAGGSRETAARKDTSETQRGPDIRITILFDLDGSTLSDMEGTRLSSFVGSARAETKGSDLSVTGYTCDLGSKAHNDILARKRAGAVAAYLRKAGVYPSLVTGVGKCCYATKDPDKRSLNRRVEVRAGKREVTQ
jgi:OmpA-OmpF porin, OOP family